MRILASNPDTIGDVLLRQPLYRALLDAGHELTLIVRPLLTPLIQSIAPGEGLITCDLNVYDPKLTAESPRLLPVIEQARAFNPDVFIAAPYQWTMLEERLSIEFPSARSIAMKGRLFSDPSYGPAPAVRLRADQWVDVAEDAPEIRKNELLAGAVLGSAVTLPDPRLEPAAPHLAAADAVLARLGIEAGDYWVGCVGSNKFTSIRNWRAERWSRLLGAWAKEHGRKFLLIGHESEMDAAKSIRDGMGDQSGAATLWSGAGDGDLDVLIGLVARSAGYVGRDTGPMHLAAALSKPVLAVFGGGTWPRFLPAVTPSVSLAVGVPCVGCGWVCHLPESYCIKEVPVEAVLKAASELETGTVSGRRAELIKADPVLLSRIGREGAVSARGHLTQLSFTRREHMEQTDSLAALLERSLKQAGRADMLAEELDGAKAEMVRRESLLKQRLAAAENTAKVREAELNARIAQMESALSDGTRKKEIDAAVVARTAALETDCRERIRRAQEELAAVTADCLKAKSDVSDLRLQVTRFKSDQGVLTSLTRQQEGEVVVLRGRLKELLASRWRRYGQRVGLCMTMPWEQEMTNGKH